MRQNPFVALFIVAALGCGGTSAAKPSSLKGSFSRIEDVVADIHNNVFAEHFSGDIGTDPLGPALSSFIKATTGTPLAADADAISKKVYDLDVLASTHPPIDKLRSAVQDLEQTVAAVKKKL